MLRSGDRSWLTVSCLGGLALGFLGCWLVVTPASAQVGTRVMRGQIQDRTQNEGIAQAVVTLGDSLRALTDATGRFEIRGIRPGRLGFTVEALGYRPVHTVIVVTGEEDVSALIQMDPEPIALDSLAIRPRKVSIRGRIVATGTDDGVAELTVRAGSVGQTATNTAGGFRFAGLYAGSHVLSIEGFGWSPLAVVVEASGDTILLIEIERDRIMERIIERQIARLDERARSTGQRLVAVARERILRSRAATPVDVLVGEAGLRVVDCGPTPQRPVCIDHPRMGIVQPRVYIDDVPRTCGLLLLRSYPNGVVERLEVLDSGAMIRAYTRRFIEQMNAREFMLSPLADFDRVFQC